MRTKNAVKAITGVAIALTLSTDAFAGLIGFVELDIYSGSDARPVPAGGGGVTRALIGSYRAPNASAQTPEDVLGPTGTDLYMMCIEFDEGWDTSNRWYAIYEGIVGQPSRTGDIVETEERLIERVLTAEFTGFDFQPKNAGADRTALVKGLQALVWEAGAQNNVVGDDFDGVDDRGTGGKALAEEWIGTYSLDKPYPDDVVTYALVAVNFPANGSPFVSAGRQDFMVYRPDISETRVPTPGPLALIGLGLAALIGSNRRHTVSHRPNR